MLQIFQNPSQFACPLLSAESTQHKMGSQASALSVAEVTRLRDRFGPLGDVVAHALPMFSLDICALVTEFSQPIAGKCIDSFGSEGMGPGCFNFVYDCAVAKDGSIVVVSGGDGGGKVQVFREDGAFSRLFAAVGFESGQLCEANCIAIDDSTDEVFVTEGQSHHGPQRHRVSVFSLRDYSFLRCWGSQGSANGQFLQPKGIAMHPQSDAVVVADARNHRVQLFSRAGDFVRTWGRKGGGDEEFDLPFGAAVTAAGEVVISEYAGNSIKVWCVVAFGLLLACCVYVSIPDVHDLRTVPAQAHINTRLLRPQLLGAASSLRNPVRACAGVRQQQQSRGGVVAKRQLHQRIWRGRQRRWTAEAAEWRVR